MSRVIAVTGATGYLAQHLMGYLYQTLNDIDHFIGLDIRKVNSKKKFPTTYYQMDILDLKAEILEEHGVTDLIHMAWTVTPTHNQKRAYKVDIEGTKIVLREAERAGVEYFLHTSSTLAYGAFPDNEIPLTENHPLRGNKKFHYPKNKMLVEQLLDDFEANYKGTMLIGRIRPSIILSPDLKNYFAEILKGGWRTFFLMPYSDPETPVQFLHVNDAIQAFTLMMKKRLQGAYNATPDYSITIGDIPKILEGRGVQIPLKILRVLLWFQWQLRISQAPPSYLDFAAYPFVVSNEKLSKEGYKPKYSSEESIKLLKK
ncbi:MAG: NAD-dependent epimerase/dehydratase family protein [Candidatus Hodarchaeales archaeon]|jgi:UDP-glucose 4-epimerase